MAMPTNASGHQPHGGTDAASNSPAATARRTTKGQRWSRTADIILGGRAGYQSRPEK